MDAQQQPKIDSNSGTSSMERRQPVSEDPSMTIEFLRARLLSERSVSKAARQHAQQLAKKVLELERQLESEIQLREKFESARLEALSRYKDELISEYGHWFVSNSGEEDSHKTIGGSSAVVASGSRSNCIDNSSSHGRTGGENALASNHLEDEECSSMGRMGNFEVGGSSKQGSFEEDRNKGNFNDDDEIELMGREKGILAWGRRKAERRQPDKDRGQNTEMFGRTFSQKSLVGLSSDGESPHKRWVGKSVRQIRKKENRLPDTNSEDGPRQIQDPEGVGVKSSYQEAIKGGLRCDGEGDTEVERVLEQQAELIERFEAEESAQMAWEEKFRQQTPPSLGNTSNQDSSPNSSVQEENNMASIRDEQRNKEEAWCNQVAYGLSGADDNVSNKLVEDVINRKPQKVRLEDCVCENTQESEEKLHPVCKAASEDSILDNGGTDLVRAATSEASTAFASLQGSDGSLVGRMAALSSEKSEEETQLENLEEPKGHSSSVVSAVMTSGLDPADKSDSISHNQALPMPDYESIDKAQGDFKESQDLTETLGRDGSENQANSSSTDIEGGEMHVRVPSVKHEGLESPDLRNKELSSFKFSSSHEHVNLLGEDVASGSHQLIEIQPRAVSGGDFSFGLMMPNAVDECRDQSKERISVSALSASEFNTQAMGGSCHEQTLQILRVASNHQGLNKSCLASPAKIDVRREDTAVETEASVDTQEGITQSSWGGENSLNDGNSSHASSDNFMKDSPLEEIRRRMRTKDTGKDQTGQIKNFYGFPAYPDLRMQEPFYASSMREGINLDNSPPLRPSRTAIPDYSGPWACGTGSYVYQDIGGRIIPRKSVEGGFDRVTEVLRVLQIAKHQIQSSDQPARLVGDLDTAYKSENDGREGFYVEPPNSFYVSSQVNLGSPASYPASPRDSLPAGYSGSSRFTLDSPYPAGQVPPHFAVPGHAPYYSSLHRRGAKPFMPDLEVGTAVGYAGSPSPRQQSSPWVPQGAHITNVYQYDARNHR